MTDRERDALIAEKVMGWVKVPVKDGPPGSWRWLLPNGVQLGNSEYWPEQYSTNRNAAAVVLERIAELGLERKFLDVLDLQKLKRTDWRYWDWERLMATPAQLCDAALACVAGKEAECR